METEGALSFTTGRAGPNFDPYLSLCKSLVLEAKYWDLSRGETHHFKELVHTAIKWAAMSRKSSQHALFPILGALHNAVTKVNRSGLVHFDKIPEGCKTLFPLALELNLDWWVASLLNDGRPTPTSRSFRRYAIRAMLQDRGHMVNSTVQNQKSLELLLHHGVLSYDKETTLTNLRSMASIACQELKDQKTPMKESRIIPWVDIVELMIQHGADGYDLVSSFLPTIAYQLEQELPKVLARLESLKDKNNGVISLSTYMSQRHKRKADDENSRNRKRARSV